MGNPAQAFKEAMDGLTPRRTIAVAESLTAGHLQALIASVPGASAYFLGGITVYSIEEKVRLLGLDEASVRAVNAVSEEVARSMARSVLNLFRSDIALSTTGYAETVLSPKIEIPFAWWAIAWRERTSGKLKEKSGKIVCPEMSRVEVQRRIAKEVVEEATVLIQKNFNENEAGG